MYGKPRALTPVASHFFGEQPTARDAQRRRRGQSTDGGVRPTAAKTEQNRSKRARTQRGTIVKHSTQQENKLRTTATPTGAFAPCCRCCPLMLLRGLLALSLCACVGVGDCAQHCEIAKRHIKHRTVAYMLHSQYGTAQQCTTQPRTVQSVLVTPEICLSKMPCGEAAACTWWIGSATIGCTPT